MKVFKGKRLLHVGGGLFQTPALARAKALGCTVIVVDQNPDAPGRRHADVFVRLSTRDRESVLTIAREERADGVMTYASDSSVATVAYVAQQLGLPGNPPEAAETLRRKDLFRKFQMANGLPHPVFFSASTVVEVFAKIHALAFPVVVKPVDSAGTAGQSVIHSRGEVERAFHIALANSRSGRAVIEEFIHTDLMELDGDVWFENGRLAFRLYGHNHFLKNRLSNVPSGEIFPGVFDDVLSAHLDGQFDLILRGLGLRSGCMNFDALARDGRVYILDVGLRNGGNFVPDAIQLSRGVDLTEAAVYGALGVEYPAHRLACATPKPVATYLFGTRYPGRYEGVEFSKEIQPYLVETRPFIDKASPIEPYTRADKAAGMAFFSFPDMRTLCEKMERIEDLVKVRVTPIRLHEPGVKSQPPRGELVIGEYKEFPELLSPFLRTKLSEAQEKGDLTIVRVLSRQYIETEDEVRIRSTEGLKHYESSEKVYWEGEPLSGVERLYRRVILFEPLYQCIANCRYCLRRNYDLFHHSHEDIQRIARFIGQAPGHQDLREVLITGGDPFLAPYKVGLFLDTLAEAAPQIRIARVATRVPIQQPDRVNEEMLEVLAKRYPFRIEVATQINHACELYPEVEAAYRRIRDRVPLYNQTVLLRGVNDTFGELVELCDRLRDLAIEHHYLFHCVPIGGLNSLRTPLMWSIDVARQLSASGLISGRSKPQFCIMTSIGKITPYEGTIIDYKDNKYLLRSAYSYEERLAWNPSWQLPANAVVGGDGRLCVWYEDVVEEGVMDAVACCSPVRGSVVGEPRIDDEKQS